MSDQDVVKFLEYVPIFRELEYIETDVLLVERHMMEGMMSKGKSVVIKEIVYAHDVVRKDLVVKVKTVVNYHSNEAGKDGTAVETKTEASTSKQAPLFKGSHVNDFGVFDYDNEFRPTWSAERMNEKRANRMSDEFEFRKLLAEIDNRFGLKNSSQDDGVSISEKEEDLETLVEDEEIDELDDEDVVPTEVIDEEMVARDDEVADGEEVEH
ncbi:hypothetical protein Tco_0620758 [Tanacetum coccineum]